MTPLARPSSAAATPRKFILITSNSERLTTSRMSTSEQFDTEASPRPKRKKKIQEDVSARHRREQDKERQSQQEQRRTLLQEKLFRSGQREDLDLARLVINATGDQESSIRIHDHIAGSIKPHQIDGVRFMWNQIVGAGEEEETQGCLLAHTMGKSFLSLRVLMLTT